MGPERDCSARLSPVWGGEGSSPREAVRPARETTEVFSPEPGSSPLQGESHFFCFPITSLFTDLYHLSLPFHQELIPVPAKSFFFFFKYYLLGLPWWRSG